MAVSNPTPWIGYEAASPIRGTEQGPSALCQLPANEPVASLSLAAVLLVEFAVYLMYTGDPAPNRVSTQ